MEEFSGPSVSILMKYIVVAIGMLMAVEK